MNWSDERYVRLYVRDSTTWLKWSWQARATFALLLRKMDRNGMLPLDGEAPADAISLHTGLPIEVVEPALVQLLRPGKDAVSTLVVNGDVLRMPNYKRAQEAHASAALRAREYRERRQQAEITQSDDSSRSVTEASHSVMARHEISQAVTPSLAEPSLAEPSLAEPSLEDPPLAPPGGADDSHPGLSQGNGQHPAPADNGITGTPKRKRPRTRSSKIPGHLRPVAERVFSALCLARQRVIPRTRELQATDENLQHIAARLEHGATEDDCLHVIAVREAEVRENPDAAQWFNAVTPFRPEWFAMSLGMPAPPPAPPQLTPEQLAAAERETAEQARRDLQRFLGVETP